MRRLYIALGIVCLSVISFMVISANKPADAQSCKTLRDPDAYGKKHDNYKFLVPGRDGWYFRTKQDLWSRYNLRRNEAALQDFIGALKANGVEPVIAYLPTRGIAADAYLPEGDPMLQGFDPAAVRQSYAAYIKSLNDRGIRTVGTPALKSGPAYYYRADHHWTAAGADEMAAALAQEITALAVYKSIPKMEFETGASKPISFEGSFNEVLEDLCNTKAPPEQDEVSSIVPKGATGASSLFGDQAVPSVVLIGTSNSKRDNNDINFDGLLKKHLSVDVENAAISGGGIDDPMLAYLASAHYREHPAKVLVWEIPGYYDLDGEEMRRLLRQVIPAAHGECQGDNILASGNVKLTQDRMPLFTGLEAKPVDPATSYLYLQFDAPVKKKFTAQLDYSGAEKETLKFSRSSRYPHDGLFFYQLPAAKKGLSSISLNVPKELKDLTVQAKLCRVP